MSTTANLSALTESQFWTLVAIDSLVRADAARERARTLRSSESRRYARTTALRLSEGALHCLDYAAEVSQ